ncbi:MAG: PIG-L family deacetylase [Chloroflexi bacterium]|nr:PIG-L family deacetylase [Chloroflexota bacterium]
MTNLLVVTAHLDDAPIFCGGTILSYVNNGKSVFTCSITKPKSSTEEKQSQKAFSLLNCPYKFLNLESANLTFPDNIINMLVDLLRELKPQQVITHWEKDSNPGHIRTLQAIQTAITKIVIESNGEYPRELFAFNTYYAWGYDRTPFPSSDFVATTPFWEKKIKSIKCFKNQWTNIWIEMAEIMDRLNGLRCGEKYAEAFIKMATLSSLKGGEKAKEIL